MTFLGHSGLLSFAMTATSFWLQASGSTAAKLTFRKLYDGMGWMALGVLVVLMVMSIYSIAVMIERQLTFKAASRQSRAFVPRMAEMLKTAQLDEALKLSQEYNKSHLAVVLNSGLQELAAGRGLVKASRQMRKAKRALRRATTMKTAELQRGLSSLATIGSTAPFVGLFGTVMGIFDAFQKMSEAEGSGMAVVAGGISEALITTAFGLIVAVPAVWMYNYFTSRVNVFAIEMHNSADELIDYFLQQQEAAGEQ